MLDMILFDFAIYRNLLFNLNITGIISKFTTAAENDVVKYLY